ncbi:MAG: alpha/beta fold hydrolase [Victivallales bacterium]|nr:alpha/beta fold hydrolase [Victivallales bacterium]
MIREIDGVRIHWEESGEHGSRVLLLHGWGCDGSLMRPVADALKEGHRILIPDFPGHGESGRPPEPWGVPEYAEILVRLLRETGFLPCAVIAHSFGCRVAAWIAVERRPADSFLGRNAPKAVAAALPTALGGLLGLAYYLTLGSQFRLARIDAGEISRDWWTASSSALHVLLALAAHLGVLLVPLGLALVCKKCKQILNNKIVIIIISWLGAEALMYLAAGRQTVPFPRNSLVFFPLVTFAALLALRALPRHFCRGRYALGAAGVAILLGLSITSWQERICLKMVRAGDIPQDLLKQQYRGDDSIRTVVRNLHEAGLCDSAFLLVSDNDGTVAKWHYDLLGHSARRVYDRTELYANPYFWRQADGTAAPVFVVARLAPEAEQLYSIAAYPISCQLLMEMKFRAFYGP